MPQDSASLLDIAKAAKLVLRFTQGIDQNSLEADEEKLSVVLYQIAILQPFSPP